MRHGFATKEKRATQARASRKRHTACTAAGPRGFSDNTKGGAAVKKKKERKRPRQGARTGSYCAASRYALTATSFVNGQQGHSCQYASSAQKGRRNRQQVRAFRFISPEHASRPAPNNRGGWATHAALCRQTAVDKKEARRSRSPRHRRPNRDLAAPPAPISRSKTRAADGKLASAATRSFGETRSG